MVSKNKKYMFLIIIILAIILFAINGLSYAKYVSNSIWNYYLQSKGFYLTSSELGINTITNTNNMWNNDKVYFDIFNSQNISNVSEFDIDYKVTCTVINDNLESVNCHLNGTNSNIYNGVISNTQGCINQKDNGINVEGYNQTLCNNEGYEWDYITTRSHNYFELSDDININDISVKIEVESTSPYKKKISGIFKLHNVSKKDDKIDLKYSNYNDYERLSISNFYNTNKCLLLAWDSNDILIDTTLEDLISYETDESGYINKIKFNILKKQSLSYIFYKRNDNIIDENSFSTSFIECQ